MTEHIAKRVTAEVVPTGAFRPVEGFMALSPKERKVVAALVLHHGDREAILESVEMAEDEMECVVGPSVLDAVAYYQNDLMALEKALVAWNSLESLMTTPGKLRKGTDIPPETQRKVLRDMMEARGHFPKVEGIGGGGGSITINVNMPWWKKDE